MTEAEYRALADRWHAAYAPRWQRPDQQGYTGGGPVQEAPEADLPRDIEIGSSSAAVTRGG